MSEPEEVAPGLIRWIASHPQWQPAVAPGGAADWEQQVGSVLFDNGRAVALIDPLVPGDDREGFLGWLDGRVAGRPVSVHTTIRWHRRTAAELAARYGANRVGEPPVVPEGLVPKPFLEVGEVMFWLPAAATLVPGDRLLGDGAGGLRVCPQSWLDGGRLARPALATLMRPLLELAPERVLVSHGEPVLAGAAEALERAIERAESQSDG